jgi:transcriptional regulator with PAS, ATPase and Fis domain
MRGTQPISIITQNEQMRDILHKLDKISMSDSSVLLVGETGVGKEIFADYIHKLSSRSLNPMVKIGLSAMPSELMASELFGHEKGAYTSAETTKKGLFEIAHTGSIFLDDIDDTPLDIQSKLLRVLESREIMPIGGMKTKSIDIRLICASKVNLQDMVKRNLFRSDLFYRINVVTVEIPPLRDRLDDVPLLVNYFIQKYSPNRKLSITRDALAFLTHYNWPGNIRELRNVVQRAVLFAENEITINEISKEISQNNPIENIINACSVCFNKEGMEFTHVIDCLEHRLLHQALLKADGNQSNAAKLLNLSLSTFRDKLKKHNDTLDVCSESHEHNSKN